MSCPFALLGILQINPAFAANTRCQSLAFCAASTGVLARLHSNPFQREVPSAGDSQPHSPPLSLTCEADDGRVEAWGRGSLARLCCVPQNAFSGVFLRSRGHRGSSERLDGRGGGSHPLSLHCPLPSFVGGRGPSCSSLPGPSCSVSGSWAKCGCSAP